MTIKAEVVKDSVGPNGVRITTFLLTYPRMIHAEFMTHRVFSRNAASSRAIPFKRQLEMIKKDMVVPLLWTANQKGMQGGSELPKVKRMVCETAWRSLGHLALKAADALDQAGLHKQYVNRIIEPWSHITVVVTATEWANFYALRYHKMAMPEIQELAKVMWEAHQKSVPQMLESGEWHLPFTDERSLSLPAIYKSVARCARTSYMNHDKTETTLEQDEALHQRLVGSFPMHASPAEHQAMATTSAETWSGNFRGWIQYRKTLKGENVKTFAGPEGETA